MTTVLLHLIFCAESLQVNILTRKLFNKANYEGMRKEFSNVDWEDKLKTIKTMLTTNGKSIKQY